MSKAYLSNIHPRWPFERQEALLAEHVPGWPKGVTIYRDELYAQKRRAHKVSDLVERASMLRPIRRGVQPTTYIPTLAALAWSEDDAMACVATLLDAGSTVHILDAGLMLAPGAKASDLAALLPAFKKARGPREGGREGWRVTVAIRKARVEEGLAKVRHLWPLPSSEHPTAKLVEISGLSVNTLRTYLKPRPVVQKARLAAAKRKETLAGRKAEAEKRGKGKR